MSLCLKLITCKSGCILMPNGRMWFGLQLQSRVIKTKSMVFNQVQHVSESVYNGAAVEFGSNTKPTQVQVRTVCHLPMFCG